MRRLLVLNIQIFELSLVRPALSYVSITWYEDECRLNACRLCSSQLSFIQGVRKFILHLITVLRSANVASAASPHCQCCQVVLLLYFI
jgi:hypothetical protein